MMSIAGCVIKLDSVHWSGIIQLVSCGTGTWFGQRSPCLMNTLTTMENTRSFSKKLKPHNQIIEDVWKVLDLLHSTIMCQME